MSAKSGLALYGKQEQVALEPKRGGEGSAEEALLPASTGRSERCEVSQGIPDEDMYLLLNTFVGGSWSGAPNATTVFPQYTDIDYVRVYKSAP